MALVRRYPRTVAVVLSLLASAVLVSAFAPAVLGQASRPETIVPLDGCPGSAEPFVRTELFFGSNKPDGTVVCVSF
jgi:hypothetical protein